MKRVILIIIVVLLGLVLRAQSVTYSCRYWFDQNHAQDVATTFTESTWQAEIDVGLLSEGLHTFHVQVMDTSLQWGVPQSYIFMKADEFLLNSGNTGNLTYHCWFDEDFEHQQINSLGDGNLLLNVNDLGDGLHTIHVMLEGSTLTATQSYTFMKIAVEAPSTELQYTCWFDQDYDNAQTGPLGSGFFELEVGDLANGIHTVNVQLNNGSLTAPQTYVFYKRPMERYTIARWEYWINDDFDNRTTTNLSPTVDTLDIISLLPVGHPDIRSSCFHFHPNGDEPYINAKNQITFRFFDNEYRFFDKSALYVDYQVSQGITAQVFERNTTETFTAPRDNQIRWFKLEAGVGDSLVFKADKACTMQLFAPSGKEVYATTASEAMVFDGCHAWEDGTYYLAVHDVTGSGENISITYNWIYRYAILAYDVHLVGNGGCSTITFQGNGFNSLLDVYLINAQNDTIRRIDIGHESNTTTTVTLDFYQKNLGAYDAVFQFYGEIIRINGALEVQEPVDIVLTSSMSYPSTFRSGTECIYTYTITNNGNMTAYNIPLNMYIASETKNGISRLSMEGLELNLLYDFVKDSYEWSDIERENLKSYSDYIGEDIYFFRACDADETTGDTVYIRSGLFMTAISPYTTKTITIKITSSEPVETWVKYPTEWFAYIEQNFKNSNSDFCCNIEEFIDIANNYSISFGVVAILAQVAAFALGATGVGVAAVPFLEEVVLSATILGCAEGMVGGAASAIERLFCSDNYLSPSDFGMSVLGFLAGCTYGWENIIPEVGKDLQFGGSLLNLAVSIESSKHISKNPNCPWENHNGGKSTPVVPHEPNEIRGYLAESGSHYMRQEIQTITYEIESENDTTATAAAHTIIVRDTLDVNKFDVASLAANRVTIGDKVMNLHGENSFIYTLDLRPELYVIAQIQQECDVETGIVQWTITSLDPMTMEPTTDPYQGALPINYNGEGIATFTYSVNLKEPFPDGTEINNRAGIIFDLEDPIITDTWTNIIDAVKPTSYIENVTFEADTLNFSFVSSDNRSGVWYHTLYYRNDSTEMEWQVKVSRIFENSFMLRFKEYQTTEYLVMAVDSAGNVEDKEMMAEYIHYYDGPIPLSHTIELSQGWNWWSTDLNITLNDLKAALEATGNPAITIKSKTHNIYYQNGRWRGTLNFDVAMMYKVYVGAACEITLEGLSIDPSEHPIIIHYGPNWIGFPFGESMTLDAAFAGFAIDGDVIKHKGGSANYLNGHWRGAFNLEPGKGYIYRSNQSSDRTLTFPSSGK